MSGGGFDETAYLRAEECAAQLRRLKPGASFVFAKGARPDPAHPTVAMVKALVAEGRATVHLAGRDRDGRLLHTVRGAVAAAAAAGRAGRGRSGAGLDPAGPEMAVYAVLCDAAARGVPCPSNSQLADMADHPKAWTARDAGRAYEKLVALGMVRVVEPARYGPRVIEIAATGKRTASAPMDGVAA